MKGAAGCSYPGVVTGVRQHHGGKHVVVDIAHGRKSAPKKGAGKKAAPAPYPGYDDRPSSSMVIPAKHAHKFPVGKRVTPSLAVQPDDDGDMGEDLDQMQSRLKGASRRNSGGFA